MNYQMKTKLIYSMLILATSVFVYSCEDFIVTKLDKKLLTILAPANNTSSPSFNQLFKWEELKGADKYQLQIVQPAFSAVQQFLLDTTTTATQFRFTFSSPGTYQWRIRAKNNTSQTEYQTFNLTIDSTLSLSSSKPELITPANNFYSKSMINTFTWSMLPNVDTYFLQILSGATTVSNQPTSALSKDYTFTAEGTYQWRVYAQNSFSTSSFNTRTIVIDTARPAVPTPVSPISDTTSANPILLKWSTATTADSSHLQIAIDSLFTAVIAGTKDTTIARVGTQITYNFYSAIVGTKYYWRVQDVDRAGNKSAYFYRKRIKRN